MTRIAHIQISNILGIDHLEFSAGQFNRITGENGSGKTSVLEAIKSVIGDGADTGTLLRNGEAAGETVLVLDDGVRLRRRVTESGSYLSVTDAQGKNVAGPAEAIKRLTDRLSVNPLEFLRAKPKERVSRLLEALPGDADMDRIRGIIGDPKYAAGPGTNSLAQIDAARLSVFEDRTGTNRVIREKEASIGQLRSTLPTDSGGAELDPAEGPEAFEARLKALDEAKDAELTRVSKKLDGMKAEHDEVVAGLRRQIENAILDLSEKTRLAGAQRERVLARWTADRDPVQLSLTTIRANMDQLSRAGATRGIIADMETALAGLRTDVGRQTSAIDALDAYKGELLSSLPVDGLEVREGEIYRHGVIFDRLNTAQQVQISVELAKLRAGPLGVICVDGIESLDSTQFEIFRDAALESDLQMFITCVSDEPEREIAAET